MINDLKKKCRQRMEKAIEALNNHFAKIRTGRANPGIVEHIKVDYYGTEVPVAQIAHITVLDSHTLGITPWEKGIASKIEKAIRDSDLGVNPIVTGDLIRLPLPPLTEERRREMTKIAKHEVEQAKVAVRNIRRDIIAEIKDLQKAKEVSEDEAKRAEEDIQKLTNEFINTIDQLMQAKEKELMSI